MNLMECDPGSRDSDAKKELTENPEKKIKSSGLEDVNLMDDDRNMYVDKIWVIRTEDGDKFYGEDEESATYELKSGHHFNEGPEQGDRPTVYVSRKSIAGKKAWLEEEKKKGKG